MIVPMKKITVVLTEESRKASLKALRKAGMLHLERDSGSGRAPDTLVSSAEYLEQALTVLPTVKTAAFTGSPDRETAREDAESILNLKEKERVAHSDIRKFAADLDLLAPWGDFEPADLNILRAKGLDLRLVDLSNSDLDMIKKDEESNFISLRKGKNSVSGVLVYIGDAPDDSIECLTIPDYGMTELQSLMEERQAEISVIEKELLAYAEKSSSIEAALAQIRQDIEFEEIRSSLSGEEGLAWFTGYAPVDDVESVKTLAASEAWGLMISDPAPEDPVPSLVKNTRAIRIIQPVFDLMGIYPGYHESDISFWFLAFLSIFVAMILGDAAYGLIILGLVLAVRIKSGKPSDVLKLLTVFGAATFLWGAVTGTWFSSLALVQDTPLQMLVIPALATYQQELYPGYTVQMSIFPGDALDATAMVKWVSLLLGVVMLSIARIQSFVKKLPSSAALAQLGWLSIVLALYWLIMQLVLQLSPLPFLMNMLLPMILGGFALIVVFGGQKKGQSFGMGVLAGLKDILPTALNSIGAFGDIISFIRLFAVGLAGVALSQSFNGMAPKGGGFAIVAAVLILVFGHTLNLVLNALSVLVHGVRLNVLEFSGHLDMEWAGIGFDPFRLRVPESESPETDKE